MFRYRHVGKEKRVALGVFPEVTLADVRAGACARACRSIAYTPCDLPSTLTSATNNTKVGFEYGPNREKIRRLNYANASATSATNVTLYIDSAEAHLGFGVVERCAALPRPADDRADARSGRAARAPHLARLASAELLHAYIGAYAQPPGWLSAARCGVHPLDADRRQP